MLFLTKCHKRFGHFAFHTHLTSNIVGILQFFYNGGILSRYHIKIRLYRHKEQLKKDILKKRALLEKELQIEIQKELVSELAARAKQERTVKQEESKAVVGPSTKRR